MKERPPRPSRSSRPARPPEYLQTSFLAPEDATLFAELTRLRLLINELTARYGRQPGREGGPAVTIHNPKDIADLLMPEMQELPHEEFRAVLLNAKNGVLDVPTIYKGTLTSAPIRVAEVFKPAILANAASLIAVHNHPSGDPAPSPEDVRTTGQLVQAGRLLDVELVDHVIIGRGRYVSLKERGLGFG